MARIVITSLGTMGDFVPYVALAQGLQQRGHQVLAAINPAMHGLFQRAGIATAACGPAFGPQEARQVARAFDGWRPRTPELAELDIQINAVEANYRDLRVHCCGADLLVASTLQCAAPQVAEELGIPWICVSTTPEEFAHGRESAAYREPPDVPLVLLVSSPIFCAPNPSVYPHVRATGFWFYAGREQPGWAEPDERLRSFVERGDPPLALLPASIPVEDASQVVAVHAEAAAMLGRRLIVQPGWAGLSPDALDRSRIFFAEHLPHDWLLPRCAALIFRGGMGTLARALRDACPMLVEPYGRDCFYNAKRLLELGVAAAMNPHKVTAEGVAKILKERVIQDNVKEQARHWADRIAAEDGVSEACRLVEHFLSARGGS